MARDLTGLAKDAADLPAIALLKLRWREPSTVFSAFADEPWALGLLSGGEGTNARWSYLARMPDKTLTVQPTD
ncbi:MAG TPA: hypothetical protein VJP88_06000, partial [Caulobacteraceae bacterium]|nr:hypothetical protein [Caulobacteraceae bacterium]